MKKRDNFDHRCNPNYVQEKIMQLEDKLKDLLLTFMIDLDEADVLYTSVKSVTEMVYDCGHTENASLKLLKVAIEHGIIESIEKKKRKCV